MGITLGENRLRKSATADVKGWELTTYLQYLQDLGGSWIATFICPCLR